MNNYMKIIINALKQWVEDKFTTVEGALNNKVDVIEGKGLSTEDYTTEEKNKLNSIESGAQANIQADLNQNNPAAPDYVKNRTHWVDADGVAHTIDEKFIPDSIARVSDIPEVPVTSVNGQTGDVAIEIPEIPVTSVNGMTGDVVVEIPEVEPQVQADWAQNDETAVDYVKNRSHWREADATVLVSVDNHDFSNKFKTTCDFTFVQGEEYIVVIDGVSQTYTAQLYSTLTYIGTLTADPFIAASNNGSFEMQMANGGTHSVQILVDGGYKYNFDTEFAKSIQSDWDVLDKNALGYINNKPFYKSLETGTTILSGAYGVSITDLGMYVIGVTIIPGGGGGFILHGIELDYELVLGETYNVWFGGQTTSTSILKQYPYNDYEWYLGNLAIAPDLQEAGLEDTGENFIILIYNDPDDSSIKRAIMLSNTEIRTVYGRNFSLSGTAYKYHPIDERYLPDTILKKKDAQSDWAQSDTTATDYIKNRTHWLEGGELISEQPIELEFATSNIEGAETLFIPMDIISNLEDGTYSVEWNGEMYSGLSLWSRHSWVLNYSQVYDKLLGNPYLSPNADKYQYKDPNSSVYPFLFCVTADNPEHNGIYIKGTEPCTVTLNLFSGTPQYHQLDERYIPDTIARKSDLTGGGSQIDALPMPPTASVGQFIRVAAVDENGRVTATEAVSLEDLSEVLF